MGEAGGLRGERTRLLLLLLLGLANTGAKRTAILRNAGVLVVAAGEGIRIRVHGGGDDVELDRGRVLEKGDGTSAVATDLSRA